MPNVFEGIRVWKAVLYVFVALLVGFGSGYLVKTITSTNVVSSPIQNVTTITTGCSSYVCNQVTRPAEFEIMSDTNASGIGNFFGGNTEIDVTVKNIDSEGAQFQAIISCETLQKAAKDIFSDKMYVGPNKTITFKIPYEISARENWKCGNYRVTGEAVKACELKEIK